MGHMIRVLRQWPTLQKHCCNFAVHHLLFSSPPCVPKRIDSRRFSLATVHSAPSEVQRGRRLPKAPVPAKFRKDDRVSDDPDVKKSRNQLKREARKAVHWGMDLAAFSTHQINLILRVVSLDKDVFDAIMFVKKLGPDVREGKRRQFNYIGKLLRDVEPKLMDCLIKATKEKHYTLLRTLTSKVALHDDDNSKPKQEEKEEGPHVDIATRWLDGLISKDNNITKEIYSLQTVEFDRQELRRLVREVLMVEERKAAIEGNGDEVNMNEVNTAITNARKALTRFLYKVAKQLPSYDDEQ